MKKNISLKHLAVKQPKSDCGNGQGCYIKNRKLPYMRIKKAA